MTSKSRVAATGLALAVCGCSLGPAIPLSADVIDVRLTAVGLLQQQLAVTLCVTNPNVGAFTSRGVTADLDVSGALLASGVSDTAVVLPPVSSVAVPFTVVTTAQNLGPQLLGVLRSGGVDYRVHGTVTLDGFLKLTVPYSRAGRLDPLGSGFDLAMAAAVPAISQCSATPPNPPLSTDPAP